MDWRQKKLRPSQSIYMKIYEKVRPKLRPKYVQTTTKEDRKLKILNFKGWYLLYKAKFWKNFKANMFIFPKIFTSPIIVPHQCSPLNLPTTSSLDLKRLLAQILFTNIFLKQKKISSFFEPDIFWDQKFFYTKKWSWSEFLCVHILINRNSLT